MKRITQKQKREIKECINMLLGIQEALAELQQEMADNGLEIQSKLLDSNIVYGTLDTAIMTLCSIWENNLKMMKKYVERNKTLTETFIKLGINTENE